MSQIIQCYRSDVREIVEDERLKWIIEILIMLEVPAEVIENYDDIDNYRYDMEESGVEVDYNISNGTVTVYKKKWHDSGSEDSSGYLAPTEDHIVAQWHEPERVKRIEGKEIYYELHLNEWSVFNMR